MKNLLHHPKSSAASFYHDNTQQLAIEVSIAHEEALLDQRAADNRRWDDDYGVVRRFDGECHHPDCWGEVEHNFCKACEDALYAMCVPADEPVLTFEQTMAIWYPVYRDAPDGSPEFEAADKEIWAAMFRERNP